MHSGSLTHFTGHLAAQSAADIRIATADDIPALLAAEAAASRVSKERFLSAWFAAAEGRRGREAIVGFCTVRACGVGSRIGPLRADNHAIAQRLVAHAATIFDAPLILDVPDTSLGLTAVC